METYIIRVNGIEYEVEVEKKESGQPEADTSKASDPSKASAPSKASSKLPAQGAQPQQQAPASKQAAKASASGGTPVTCGAAGKVWKVVAAEGAELKKGDTLVILEAMKMEIPVVMPSDGRVAAIQVSEGDSVEAGQTVATIA